MLHQPGAIVRRRVPLIDHTLDAIPIGSSVYVRRFDSVNKRWMPWRRGEVEDHIIKRTAHNNALHIYLVTRYDQPNSPAEGYVAFLGEIRGLVYEPSNEPWLWLERFWGHKWALAAVTSKGAFSGADTAWQAAFLVSSHTETEITVVVLAGPLQGREIANRRTGIPIYVVEFPDRRRPYDLSAIAADTHL